MDNPLVARTVGGIAMLVAILIEAGLLYLAFRMLRRPPRTAWRMFIAVCAAIGAVALFQLLWVIGMLGYILLTEGDFGA